MTQPAPAPPHRRGEEGTGGATALPARVTTPLLTLITQQSLDEDYQHVAEQRQAGVPRARGLAAHGRLTLLALVLFGVLVAVAAVQTARNADVTTAGREQLISRIDARRAALDEVQDRNARLRASNAAADGANRSLGQRVDALAATRTLLERSTGFGPLGGPGVLVMVDDAPSGSQDGQVRDDDLVLLVNGLWQAGARGVAVNGHRLTALSALRNSAQAIRVNGVSLSPPYSVLAVGDTRSLQADFAESTSGRQFRDVVRQFGMPFTMDNRDDVQLPAAPSAMMTLHLARAATAEQKPPVDKEESQ